MAGHTGVLLGGVDVVTSTRSFPPARHIVTEEEVVAEQGVGVREGEHAVPGSSLVAHDDHLHREDKATSAPLVLLGLVHVKRVHIHIAARLHGGGHAPSVPEMDEEGQTRRGRLVDDLQLAEEKGELVVRQQDIPVGHAQAEGHVPEDEA